MVVTGGIGAILSLGGGSGPETSRPAPSPEPKERPRAREDAGTVYANLVNGRPGAGGSGNLAGAYYRDGRFFLATVGHVATVPGGQMFDYQAGRPVGTVAYTTADAAGRDQGDGAALVDIGTGALPPLLRIATTDAVVPGAPAPIPSLATVSAAFTDGVLPSGTVACHSSFFSDSPTFAQGHGYRCGTLASDCPVSATECWFRGTAPFVASGDSGGPVWRPRPDGTVDLLGFVRHQAGNQTLIGFTPASAYSRHDWTSGVAPDFPAGPGGSFVTAPGAPPDVKATQSGPGRAEATWRASPAHPADPVMEYRILVDGRQMAVTPPAVFRAQFAMKLPTGPHQLVVQAVDRWGVARSSAATAVA
ncbi:hypothetical protein CU254_28720 [Amycolatopsis sp. AA4]|nr:hypothetical protein CU254_28720 [Amycolatopsis sp. AA4]EFL09981.1 predicted protein [Streptomyces sp. AA4]